MLKHFHDFEFEDILEVGVERGVYSECILENIQMKTFHLLDLWGSKSSASHADSCLDIPLDVNEARYDLVKNKFAKELSLEKVKMHRNLSEDIPKLFDRDSLDFIYLDAGHTYETVKHDMMNCFEHLKEGYFLLGHDFTGNPEELKRSGFGVLKAVLEFTKNNDLQILAYSTDINPSFIAIKNPDSNAGKNNKLKFIESIQNADDILIEFDDAFTEQCSIVGTACFNHAGNWIKRCRDGYENTFSWRITSPLRKVRSLINNFK